MTLTTEPTTRWPDDRAVERTPGAPAVEVRRVWRRFGDTQALRDVSLAVPAGGVLALLGPNGAGKTTLLRILTGLVDPDEGEVRFQGVPRSHLSPRNARRLCGLVPSGDRTFYLRISGLENLLFFGRLHGLRRQAATERAWACLEAVDLLDAARVPVGMYSHGMQKRLSMARALLLEPPILFVDEATHDLDPEGARRVQRLASDAAGRGTAVVWTTQRVDEIRGFADRVVVLNRGEVRFTGTVPTLMATAVARRYVVQLADGVPGGGELLTRAAAALIGLATVTRGTDPEGNHYTVTLEDDTVLGDAMALLTTAGIRVLRCREERPEVEEAFLHLTGGRR